MRMRGLLMTPYKQKVRHDPPNNQWGDCHRTAIACLLDIEPEEVPHVYENGLIYENVAVSIMNAFLSERFGLTQLSIPYPGELDLNDILQSIDRVNNGQIFILGGTSRLGVGHSVIAGRGKILHDPSPADSGIVGPMDDGYWWLTFLARDTGATA